MNEQNSNQNSVPSREDTERKMQGEGIDAENLPDRQIAEKNSAYKLSEEAGKRWLNADGTYGENNTNYNDQSSTGGNTGNSQHTSTGSTANRQHGSSTSAENDIPETVTLDTEPIDAPSKLDSVDAGSSFPKNSGDNKFGG